MWFAVCTLSAIRYQLSQQTSLVGIDARIYYRAAQAFLAGGDPWSAQVNGISFAAPPPTLIPYLPFTLIPEDLFVLLAIVACALVSVALLKVLRLPWTWLLFTPSRRSRLGREPESDRRSAAGPWPDRWGYRRRLPEDLRHRAVGRRAASAGTRTVIALPDPDPAHPAVGLVSSAIRPSLRGVARSIGRGSKCPIPSRSSFRLPSSRSLRWIVGLPGGLPSRHCGRQRNCTTPFSAFR